MRTAALINRIGETSVASNGMQMTIVKYRTHKDMDIQFEDGTVRVGVGYKEFKKGHVAYVAKCVNGNSRIGEEVIAVNGLKATIIAYRKRNDIDIRFEDGVIVTGKDYCNFKMGHIQHPTVSYIDALKSKHIGETNTANNGLKMSIIKYDGAANVTVQFETGEIREVTYTAFRNGHVGVANVHQKAKECVGETVRANNGLYMTAVKYNNAHDITVQFETGEIKSGVAHYTFSHGQVKANMTCGDIVIGKIAYEYSGQVNFNCHCSKCGKEDIMTVAEMKAHACE